MKSIITFYFSFFLIISAYAQNGCVDLSMSVSNGSLTNTSIFTATPFLTPSPLDNQHHWIVMNMSGTVIHEETTGGSFAESSTTIVHNTPNTETMSVMLNVTNPTSGIDCIVTGTLIWVENEILPGVFVGSWEFDGNTSSSGFWPSLTAEILEVNNISCFGANDGSVSTQAAGGFPNWQYSLDGGPFLIDEPNFSNLGPGMHQVVVRDRGPIEVTLNFVIEEPDPLSLNIEAYDISCYGGNNGQIVATAEGGTNESDQGYKYFINSQGPFDSGIFTNLEEAFYTITVEDDNGCLFSDITRVTEPDEVVVTSMGTTIPNTNLALPASYNYQEYVYAEPNDQGTCDGTQNETAKITEVFLSQTHRHAIGHPLLFTIGERPVYLQYAVTGTGAAPDVQVEGILNGNSIGTLCLTGPNALLPIVDTSQPNNCDYFSVTLPKDWIKQGLELKLTAGSDTRTLTQDDLKITPYTELNLVLVNIDIMDYNNQANQTPIFDDFLQELASAIPASVVRFGTFPDTLKLPTLALQNRDDNTIILNSNAVLDDNNLDSSFINIASNFVLSNMQQSVGDTPNTIYFGNTLNLDAATSGGVGSFVSSDNTDKFIQQLGHSLSLPNWRNNYLVANPDADQYSYPYEGDGGAGSGRGESWNFIQDSYQYVSPTCQDTSGTIGTERSDCMQRDFYCLETRSDGPGPWDGFSDFSARAINNFLVGSARAFGQVEDRGEMIDFHLIESNGYPTATLVNGERVFSRDAAQPQNTIAEDNIKLPGAEQIEQDVYLIYGSAHATIKEANIIYDPIKYKGTLLANIDPTDPTMFADLQNLTKEDAPQLYAHERDITLKLVYVDGTVAHTIVPFQSFERSTTGTNDEKLAPVYFSIVVPGSKELCGVELYHRDFIINTSDNNHIGNINDPSQNITAANFMDDAKLIASTACNCTGVVEVPYNGFDDDCNPVTLDDDLDQDGFVFADDCDDNNPSINPNAMEIPDNGIDEDCDGNDTTVIVDADDDGFDNTIDCDDNNPDVNPNQVEVVYNGIDDDCNPETLDDDLDQDGFAFANDCDDNNPNINPNQAENPYNGIDDDCNPETLDDDLDQDGFAFANDCDDNNPNINPNQIEEPYNGIDDDCNPMTLDDDLDQDGFAFANDCDDNNADINPNQDEEPYNSIDDDCNPETLDDDLDQDGFALANDCDDNNADINPDAVEIVNNGIDEDCDGLDLTSATHELSNTTVNIFPNPTNALINIDLQQGINFSATLYSLDGRQVLYYVNESRIDVSMIAQGTYILVVQDLETRDRIIEKIIKSKS